jgi:hypothetical protein
MSARNFIIQSSLSQALTKPDLTECERIIMTDISVFHPTKDNREHFVEPEPTEEDKEYKLGFEAGKAEANKIYQSTIQLMEHTLEALKTDFSQRLDAIEDSHARVITKCLEAVLPAASDQILVSEMKIVIERAAKGEITGHLSAEVHPDNAVAIQFLENSPNVQLNINTNDKRAEGEVVFSWERSEIVIDPMTEARTCLDLLAQAIGVSPFPEAQTVVQTNSTPLDIEIKDPS